MAKKEFRYRGKTIDDLRSMGLNEFAELLPSEQRRKLKRGFTDEQKKFIKELENKDNVKTHCRDVVILPDMVDKTVRVHSGKEFQTLRITKEMVGHTIGEFALTRKKVGHSAPGVGATKSSASISVR